MVKLSRAKRSLDMTRVGHLLVIGFCLCQSSLLFGQVSLGAGSIEGTVKDSSDRSVPNAEIAIRNIATGLSRISTTDSNGHYTALSLPIGPYEVRATEGVWDRSAAWNRDRDRQ